MTLPLKRTLRLLVGCLVVLAALAALVLRMLPPPHRPLEYMIAGTAATGIALALAFAFAQVTSIQTSRAEVYDAPYSSKKRATVRIPRK